MFIPLFPLLSMPQEIYYYCGKPKKVDQEHLTSDRMSLEGSFNPDGTEPLQPSLPKVAHSVLAPFAQCWLCQCCGRGGLVDGILDKMQSQSPSPKPKPKEGGGCGMRGKRLPNRFSDLLIWLPMIWKWLWLHIWKPVCQWYGKGYGYTFEHLFANMETVMVTHLKTYLPMIWTWLWLHIWKPICMPSLMIAVFPAFGYSFRTFW